MSTRNPFELLDENEDPEVIAAAKPAAPKPAAPAKEPAKPAAATKGELQYAVQAPASASHLGLWAMLYAPKGQRPVYLAQTDS